MIYRRDVDDRPVAVPRAGYRIGVAGVPLDLELRLTIGIQVWERRVLARVQSRRGPQTVGNITPSSVRMRVRD